MKRTILPQAINDGLHVDEVGAWVEDKHKLVWLYETLFSTGMKHKWDVRTYIDLYSGSGLVRVRETQKFLWGSPLLALQVKDPFNRYVFCESNGTALEALKSRVQTRFPDSDVCYVPRDCNDAVEEIFSKIPDGLKSLSFCFVDPFDLSVKFSTIRRIADKFVDFLILLAFGMDAKRNLHHYLEPTNQKVDDFLGLPNWRESWKERSCGKRISFSQFLAETFAERMETLGYKPVPFAQMRPVRSDVKNLPLYHLALFSRHPLAYTYWKHVLKYSDEQLSLEI